MFSHHVGFNPRFMIKKINDAYNIHSLKLSSYDTLSPSVLNFLFQPLQLIVFLLILPQKCKCIDFIINREFVFYFKHVMRNLELTRISSLMEHLTPHK